jgi:hypothetical protein
MSGQPSHQALRTRALAAIGRHPVATSSRGAQDLLTRGRSRWTRVVSSDASWLPTGSTTRRRRNARAARPCCSSLTGRRRRSAPAPDRVGQKPAAAARSDQARREFDPTAAGAWGRARPPDPVDSARPPPHPSRTPHRGGHGGREDPQPHPATQPTRQAHSFQRPTGESRSPSTRATRPPRSVQPAARSAMTGTLPRPNPPRREPRRPPSPRAGPTGQPKHSALGFVVAVGSPQARYSAVWVRQSPRTSLPAGAQR